MVNEEKKKFDKVKYNNLYNKLHNRKFACDLKIAEYDELNDFLKRHNITKVGFVRDSFKRLKEELKDK